MDTIPGSAPEATSTKFLNSWWNAPRWGGTNQPKTARRSRLIKAKREGLVLATDGSTSHGDRRKHGDVPVQLKRCATGGELVAGYYSRELYPFPLEQRRGYNRVRVPTTAHPPKWRMRAAHIRALAWIVTGMVGLKQRGVVISHKEMAILLGMSERQTGTIVRELCTWGLLDARPVFVAKGCVTSQRASCYRLTRLMIYAWRIVLPAACGKPDELPIGDYSELPPKRRKRRAPATSGVTFTIGEPLPGIRQELPANPDNTLRVYSPEEHAACPLVVSASPTIDFCTAMPNESVGSSRPETRQDESCDVPSRLCKPESGELALARRVDIDPNRFIGRMPRTRPYYGEEQRERIAERRDTHEQRELTWKQRDVLNAVDRIERKREERRGRVDDRFDDAGDGRVELDPRTRDAIRRYEDSVRDEHRERELAFSADQKQREQQRPYTKPREESLADVIEAAFKSRLEHGRYPSDAIPPDAQRALQALRRDDGGKNGGGS